MKVNSKTVLITGASRGIGYSLAKAFAKRNCSLHLVQRSDIDTDKIAELKNLGAAAVSSIPCDLSNEEEIRKLTAFFDQSKIEVDILINNAGILTGGLFEQQDFQKIKKAFQVNILSYIQLSQYFVSKMLDRDSGYIINNASVSGKMFLPCASTYAATKAGVVAFTESLEQELRPTGVNAMVMITPGVKTEMFDEIPDLYDKHLDVKTLPSISSDEWAEEVISAVEKDSISLNPKGMEKWSVKTYRFLPGLFKNLAQKSFSRQPKD
ncbi:MAG: SDR family NAD(P)-dependent oxidoreductase [Bdellovibrionales bacterium]